MGRSRSESESEEGESSGVAALSQRDSDVKRVDLSLARMKLQ
jgi:hypothetical protein